LRLDSDLVKPLNCLRNWLLESGDYNGLPEDNREEMIGKFAAEQVVVPFRLCPLLQRMPRT